MECSCFWLVVSVGTQNLSIKHGSTLGGAIYIHMHVDLHKHTVMYVHIYIYIYTYVHMHCTHTEA